ncbi:hypothetical protein [Pseudomonas sp. BE134]|uniref:hypothetical protein n=1 Tax=Pseudomonas sp. BE134 TaxID=2817843 RepID=UPI0028584B8F|nr:hypothetical protein [Pseudomonas sp. BE134]MDR6924806.1 hypothetical protein [Pseudomonas sp. BE134]
MMKLLVCITLAWAVFAIFFYRALHTRHVRHQDYAAFAKAAFASVGEHFAELKEKSVSQVVDKGFKITDDSAWRQTLETFITNVVTPRLDQSTRQRIKDHLPVSRCFSTFTWHFVRALVANPTMPKTYDLKQAIRVIEGDGDAVSFLSTQYRFVPGKVVLTRFALVLLTLGTFSVSDHTYASNGEAFTPLEACNALIDEDGFQPNASGYTELETDTYSCGTPYKMLGSQDLPNNLAMYGRGTRDQVTRVKIMLNVNVKSRATQDTKELASVCGKMVKALTGSKPSDFEDKVAKGKPFEALFEGYHVFLTKSVWKTGKGFELNCGIATLDNKE